MAAAALDGQRDVREKMEGARFMGDVLRQVGRRTSPGRARRATRPPPPGAPWALAGEHFDEARELAEGREPADKTGLAYYHVNKLHLAYLFDAPAAALDHAERAEALLEAVTAMPLVSVIRFLASLARLAVLRAEPARTELTRPVKK